AKTGDAYTLVTSVDDGMIRTIERKLGKSIERRTLEGFDYRKAPASTHGQHHTGPRPPQAQHTPSGAHRPAGVPVPGRPARKFWRARRRPR
ncbi:MAG: ATP-dependent helicase, partial [Elusimicrobia bacterium]|nr:ATP-dependent helicase [Elusimicrobiota bacterium]